MVEIAPGLLLGSEGDAMAALTRAPSFKKHGVTHLLSLTRDPLDLSDTVGVMVDGPTADRESQSFPINNTTPKTDNTTEENTENEDPICNDSDKDGTKTLEKATAVAPEDSQGPDKLSDPENKILVKFISINDMPEADLLHLFEPCCQYIQQAIRSGGTVLVHCVFGVSRSSSMVIAYLMWSQGRGFRVIHDEVKAKKPDINPNRGFREQLDLWGAMRCRYDPFNKLYKAYKLKTIAKNMEDGGYTDKVDMSPDPFLTSTESVAYYRCRKCRRLLFSDNSTLLHNVGKGDLAFKWHKRSKPLSNGASNQDNEQELPPNEDKCSSWFIEPVEWMESFLIGNVEGKVLCPKCSARLGSFNWAGEQCSCGQWVTPSFQIHKSRVDETRTLSKRKPTTTK